MLDILEHKAMIQLNRVNKIYRSKLNENVTALRNIDLILPQSGMIFIVGKSGSGKSTLLNILGGLDSPTDGEFLFNGEKIDLKNNKNADNYRKNSVGFIFQDFNLLENETVFYNVDIAARLLCKNKDDVKKIIDKVGLKEKINSSAGELSGGQQQRVAIARALIKDVDLILADEPTGNLDSETAEEIFKLLKQISKSKLVVVVSHDNDFAQRYGDRIITIKDGTVVADDIKTRPIVNEPTNNAKNKQSRPLPTKSLIKLGVRNLTYKKGRSILTTVMLFLSVMVLMFSQMLISTSSEKILGRSLPGNNITQIFLNQDKWISNGNGNVPLTYNKNTGTNFSRQGEKLITDNIPYVSKGVNLSEMQEGLIITQIRDIKNLGFELYDGAFELTEDNYVYASDYLIDENNQLITENVDYTPYIGRELFSAGLNDEKAILAGVYKTNYRKYVNWDFAEQRFKAKDNLNEKDCLFYAGFLSEMKNKIFVTQEFALNGAYSYDYNDKTYYADLNDGTRRWYGAYTVLFRTKNKEMSINDNVKILNSYGNVITERGVQTDFTLNEGEILLSKELYAALFETDYAGGVPQALGQTVEISLSEREKNFELAKINGEKVVGIIDDIGCLFSVARTANLDFKAYGLNQNFMFANIEGMEPKILTHFFQTARESFDISVNSYISVNVYSAEKSLKLVGYIFGFVALIMTVITILLIVNLIMVLIASKTKEIGILRSIGIGDGQIIFIYLMKIIILSLIALACSFPGTICEIFIMEKAFVTDSSLFLAIIGIEWQTVVLGLGFVLLLPSLITYLCLLKINKKKPVDLIRAN